MLSASCFPREESRLCHRRSRGDSAFHWCLLELALSKESPEIRKTAFAALGKFDDEAIAFSVIGASPETVAEIRPVVLGRKIARSNGGRRHFHHDGDSGSPSRSHGELVVVTLQATATFHGQEVGLVTSCLRQAPLASQQYQRHV